MSSSNRHWPSLFKSKPCSNNHHHQWQHDVSPTSMVSNPCQKPPYGSSGSGTGGEERTPEPKPRWNPKPEQIRILEAIFNSGMVNPPRDEIRKIRVQLQEYGQVGDANVFYWFQNRKSRSKHKQRQLQSRQKPPISSTIAATGPVTAVAASSSSSSSDPSNSSGTSSTSKTSGIGTTGMIDLSNSPTNSVNQTYYHHHPHPPPPPSFPPTSELQQEFLLFQPQNQNNPIYYNLSSPDLSLSCLAGLTRPSSGFWNSDLTTQQEFFKTTTATDDDHHHDPKKTTTASTAMNFNNFYRTTPATSTAAAITSTSPALSTTTTTSTATLAAATATKVDNSSNIITSPFVDMLQGVEFETSGGSRMVVFINEVAFEVGTGNLNVREAFGMEAVLLHSSGLPVPVDDWGVTLLPLQHGASYFLV